MNIFRMFVVLSVVAHGFAEEARVQELKNRFKRLTDAEQQTVILRRLPDAVEAPEEFTWLSSKLSADLLEHAQAGEIARCLLRLDEKLSLTAGARQRYDLGPKPCWALQTRLIQLVAKDAAWYYRDQDARSRAGDGQIPNGQVDVLRELVAWGRRNGAVPAILFSIEDEVNAFVQRSASGQERNIPLSLPATQQSPPPTSELPAPPGFAVTSERGSLVWFWVVGFAALTVIAILVWRRRV